MASIRTDWRAHAIVAALGTAASVVVLLAAARASGGFVRLNDFYYEAWPSYRALIHGHLLDFLRLAPAYVGSLVLRAPFALIASVWGGQRAVFFATALPCLLATVAFCLWLGAQPRRRGGIGWASRLMPIVLCIISPAVVVGLFEGHPEDLLSAVLCVCAVLLAINGRPGWASLLLALAVFNKAWALVAVPVVIVALPPEHRRALLGVVAAGGVALVALVIVHAHGLSADAAGAGIGSIWNPPQLLWVLGRHAWLVRQAHVLVVLVPIPCATLWWWIRRDRPPTAATANDALLLLALVLLLRAALDPWDNLFYHVPFLFALLAWEVRNGRMPLITIFYTVALSIVAPIGGVPHMSYNVRAGVYAALIIPTIGWITARLYVPTEAWKRLWPSRSPARLGDDAGAAAWIGPGR